MVQGKMMLKQSNDIIRYYIINTRCLEHIFFSKKRSRILYRRPSPWKVFLQGLLRLNDDLSFIRLPDSIVLRFTEGQVAAKRLGDGSLKINAHTVEIEPWTFLNMCKFAIEGIQYGTFQCFWKWKW